MKVKSTVELEAWEEAFLATDSGWSMSDINRLRDGQAASIAAAESILDVNRMDAEEQAVLEAFKSGWDACLQAIADRQRLEEAANAH